MLPSVFSCMKCAHAGASQSAHEVIHHRPTVEVILLFSELVTDVCTQLALDGAHERMQADARLSPTARDLRQQSLLHDVSLVSVSIASLGVS